MEQIEIPGQVAEKLSRRSRLQGRRAGTGRQTTIREIGIFGRHSSLPGSNTSKDPYGLDDLDKFMDTEEEGDNDDGERSLRRATASSLFPMSPESSSMGGDMSSQELDLDYQLDPVKRLSFDGRDTDDDILSDISPFAVSKSTKRTPPPVASANNARQSIVSVVSKSARALEQKPKAKLPLLKPQTTKDGSDEDEIVLKRKPISVSKENENSIKPDSAVRKGGRIRSPKVHSPPVKKSSKQSVKPVAVSSESEEESNRGSEIDDNMVDEIGISNDDVENQESYVSSDNEMHQDSSNEPVQEFEDEPPIAEKPKQMRPVKVSTTAKKTSSVVVSKAKSVPKAGGKAKARRRQTIVLIENAKESGVGQSPGPSEGGVRRGSRHRHQPLKFYECEGLNYVPGAGNLLEVSLDNPVRKEVQTPPASQPRRKAVPRKVKKKRTRMPVEESSDEDQAGDNDRQFDAPFAGEGFVLSRNGTEKKQQVAVRTSHAVMQQIKMKTPVGEVPLSAARLPLGCKLLQRDDVSIGVIELPPLGVKFREVTSGNETFFVVSGEKNCLAVHIHATEFKISKGDAFIVPTGNSYSLRNTSTMKSAKLFFTIVADDS